MELEAARSPQLHNPSPHGCVLYLPFWHNELSGSVFSSVDDFRHACTVTGALWGSMGRTFDGTDDKIVGNANIDFSGTGARTLIVWACPDSASLQNDKIGNIVSLGWASVAVQPAAGGAFGIATYGYTTKAGQWAMFGVSADVESSGLLTADTWYCLGATYTGTTVQLYQDGVADNSETQTLNTVNAPIRIAEKVYTSADRIWFKGKVGEVLFYNRALTAGEIQNNYLNTRWRYS